MNEGSPIQAVMPVGGYGGGFGGGFMNDGIWLFAILALFGLGGNGFLGNRGAYGVDGRCATVEDLNNSANFTRLESQVQGIGQAIAQQNTNLSNAICSIGYQNAVDFGALSKQIAECCCANERITLENRYLAAQNTAAINANIDSKFAALEKAQLERTIASQQNQINQLYLKDQFCGIPRILPATVYGATPVNFAFGNNCGCNGGF